MAYEVLKSRLIALALICLILLGGIFLGLKKWPGGGSSGDSRVRAPQFSLEDVEHQKHSLAEWRGHPILLHFWASWCPPCLDEIPKFAEFSARGYKDLKFVAISEDESWEKANRVLKTMKLPQNLVTLLDPGGKLPDEYGTFQFPETYLLDPQGAILTKFVGPQEWSSPEFQRVLEKLLSKD